MFSPIALRRSIIYLCESAIKTRSLNRLTSNLTRFQFPYRAAIAFYSSNGAFPANIRPRRRRLYNRIVESKDGKEAETDCHTIGEELLSSYLRKLSSPIPGYTMPMVDEVIEKSVHRLLKFGVTLGERRAFGPYCGPELPEDGPVSARFVLDMMSYFKKVHLDSSLPPIPVELVLQLLLASYDQHIAMPSLIKIPMTPPTASNEEVLSTPSETVVTTKVAIATTPFKDNIRSATNRQIVTVCGDTHGKFYDLCHIFSDAVAGFPSDSNPFLFNGDFVDRGEHSLEVVLTLLALKLAHPEAIFMLRGNHESFECNAFYGFLSELLAKYRHTDRATVRQMYLGFLHVFAALPVAAVVNDSVFVTHGGIGFHTSSMSLDEIAKIDRCKDPGFGNDGKPDVLNELLWSDPGSHESGFVKSPRGGAALFAQDVTERFLAKNNLTLMVRSHQVVPAGVRVDHSGKCVTVYSEPAAGRNNGAVLRFKYDQPPDNPEVLIFKESSRPGYSPSSPPTERQTA